MRRPDDIRARRTDLRPPGAISLARALSKFGVCSRREAERWIAADRVTVNAALERDPSRWIDPRSDLVGVDGRPVGDETPRVVIAFHKPVGFVTTRVDPGARATVYDALGDLGRWVFPVGRLDRDSSGLLILTNDHRLGERLTAPEHEVPKTYHLLVAGIPEPETLRALREGLPLEDGRLTRPARVRVLGSRRGSTWLEIVLREGRNRQLRRMCALVGHDVQQLVRVAIGRLSLTGLAVGEWRQLEPAEVARLVASSPRGSSPRESQPRPIMKSSPGGPDAAGARVPCRGRGNDARRGNPRGR